MKTTFSAHFKIPKGTSLDFLDVPVLEDLLAFICPFLIENNKDKKIARDIYDRLKAFLIRLNTDFIIKNDRSKGIQFLSHLHEPNEYHLGYSDANKGKAVGKPRAEIIFNALRNNRFAKHGVSVTNEAHFVLLLVHGIGQDIMSDIIANVCRDIFAAFTHKICMRFSIPMTAYQVEYFNSVTGQWDTKAIDLPKNVREIILVPKFLLSTRRAYSNGYNWFVAANYISQDILNKKVLSKNESAFVRTLKDGTVEAIIKRIYKFYKKPKKDLIDFVLEYQGSLDEFVAYAKEHYPEMNFDDITDE